MTPQILLAGALSVLLLGDSHALGLVKGGGPGFFQVLGQELGDGYELRLSACPGSSALDWTREARRPARCMVAGAYEALARPNLPADVAVVLLGTNDAAGFGEAGPVPAERYAQAMQELVAALLADGVRHVVLVTPPPSAGPFVGAQRKPRLEAYREALRRIAEANARVSPGPDLLELVKVGEHLDPGAVHMNAAGHRLVGEQLARDVRALAPPPQGDSMEAGAGRTTRSEP